MNNRLVYSWGVQWLAMAKTNNLPNHPSMFTLLLSITEGMLLDRVVHREFLYIPIKIGIKNTEIYMSEKWNTNCGSWGERLYTCNPLYGKHQKNLPVTERLWRHWRLQKMASEPSDSSDGAPDNMWILLMRPNQETDCTNSQWGGVARSWRNNPPVSHRFKTMEHQQQECHSVH